MISTISTILSSDNESLNALWGRLKYNVVLYTWLYYIIYILYAYILYIYLLCIYILYVNIYYI